MYRNIKRAFRILNYVGENRFTISEQKKIRCFKIIQKLIYLNSDSRFNAEFKTDNLTGETSISINFETGI